MQRGQIVDYFTNANDSSPDLAIIESISGSNAVVRLITALGGEPKSARTSSGDLNSAYIAEINPPA